MKNLSLMRSLICLSFIQFINCRSINWPNLEGQNDIETFIDYGLYKNPLNAFGSKKCKIDEDDQEIVDSDGPVFGGQPNGIGAYRDPQEVLGPKFTPKKMIYLCEADVLLQADMIKEVNFKTSGKKLCLETCNQYHDNIILDGKINVTMVQNTCDFIGSPELKNEDPSLNPGTICRCLYLVRCNKKTKYTLYSFTTDDKGYLRVSTSQMCQEIFVT